jgi:hypothetical protein
LIRVDALLYVVADKANLCHTADLIIDPMRVFFNNTTTAWSGSNSCYMFNYLWLIINLLARAQIALHSKKRAKLQKIFYMCKKIDFFFTFFSIYLRA